MEKVQVRKEHRVIEYSDGTPNLGKTNIRVVATGKTSNRSLAHQRVLTPCLLTEYLNKANWTSLNRKQEVVTGQ